MMRMGMWTSVDPLWPNGFPFLYAAGCPTTLVDITGERPRLPNLGTSLRGALRRNRRRRRSTAPTTTGRFTGRGISDVLRDVFDGKIKPPHHELPRPPLEHGNCSIMTCHDRRAPWAPWLSAHDAFCFQTANPNKACGADVIPWFFGGGSNPGGCDSYAELRRQTACAECHSRTLPCVLASLACTCIEDLKSVNPALLWFTSGTCYNLGATLLTCACEKAEQLGLPPSSYLPECFWYLPGFAFGQPPIDPTSIWRDY